MQKPIVTALLAYGMSGKLFHAPFVNFHQGFKFKGVFEHNNKRVNSDYPDVKSYDSLQEVLDDPEIELVIVNTPSNLHVEHTRQALLAGKHVLVEKPFAPTVKEAEDLFNLGRQVDKKIMIYQNRRFSSDFAVTRDTINSGKLGNIIEMHLRYDRYRAEIGPKAFKENPFPASGIVYDLAAHLLDQVICIMGRPERYRKITGVYRENSKVDDYGHIHLVYPGKKNVFITTSLLVADPLPGIVIHGTKGSFIKSFCDSQEDQLIAGMKPGDADFGREADGKDGILTTVNSVGEKNTEKVPSVRGRYIDLFEAVYQNVRNNISFPVKEEEVLIQLEILESSAE
ncbi:Gfo/Idh/MocA family oxidoreductase [Daejeonella lutea]|uniref:Predicted dehydrogenase n=1 Tax=Daejeonella lutea TaxID=572036 RepID=A0A1T5DL91_9SPHI|nr:Gfo/Idh/MocA family oxidoreductase [Daejeonella lutea]SKB72459.1 Predicted dehydrogenase [Daejeonella lutea]